MLLAAVVELEACEDGSITNGTGRDVHGLWFRQWRAVSARVADALHDGRRAVPFTVSPLLGLPYPQQGRCAVSAGSRAWFRVTALQSDLAARLQAEWLPRLPGEIELGGMPWRVLGWTADAGEHPWAGQADPQALAGERLLAPSPPHRWSLAFATPTAFHGKAGHLPFPLPSVLVSSWMQRWQQWGPVRLPDDVPQWAQRGLLVSAYALQTVPVRESGRVTIGCVGRMTLRAGPFREGERGPTGLTAGERAAIDLLAAYAFWAGSGHRTTQGLGLTRLLPEVERPPR